MSAPATTAAPSAAGNPPAPAPAPAPKSFAQRRLAQDQAAAAKRPPPEINTIPNYATMSFDQRRLAQDQIAVRRTGR
jgi:hypothetical protein